MSKQMCLKNMAMSLSISRCSICILTLMITSLLLSCTDKNVQDSAPSPRSVSLNSIPDAVPRVEPRSKYGNPKSYEVFGKKYYVMNYSKGFVERGIASWYGKKFHGRRTSNGETYDMYVMTAAHKNLPLPTYAEVTNLKNNKRIIVRVNDRGPFHGNRIIDLSYAAARKLDIVGNGTGLVEIRTIGTGAYAKKGKQVKQGASVRAVSTIGSSDGFYIQVGAFRDESNAQRLKIKIASLGEILIKVGESNTNEQALYRVQIGPLHSIDRADNIVDKLDEYGIAEHRIIIH